MENGNRLYVHEEICVEVLGFVTIKSIGFVRTEMNCWNIFIHVYRCENRTEMLLLSLVDFFSVNQQWCVDMQGNRSLFLQLFSLSVYCDARVLIVTKMKIGSSSSTSVLVLRIGQKKQIQPSSQSHSIWSTKYASSQWHHTRLDWSQMVIPINSPTEENIFFLLRCIFNNFPEDHFVDVPT